jgi:hypothetical protein
MLSRIARLSALALLALAGCGQRPPSTLEITAFPAKVPAGSDKPVLLTIRATANGVDVQNGTNFRLRTSAGTFEKGSPEMDEIEVQYAAGKAEAELYPSPNPEVATVLVEFEDVYTQKAVSKTIEVDFTAADVVRLDFRCFAKNIMVFDHAEDLNVRCEAVPRDATEREVRTAVVRFASEAGGIRKNEDGILVFNPRIGDRLDPVDVSPLGSDPNSGEPRWNDGDRVRNPRDGLVTVIAWVEGVDGDQGEPYIDVDDDNKFNPARDIFTSAMDINKNGERDVELTSILWTKIRMVWSGTGCPPGTSVCKVSPSSPPEIAKNAEKEFTFTYLDRNLNILAANNAEADSVQWNIDPGTSSAIVVGVGASRMFFDKYGININSQNELVQGESKASYTRDCEYRVKVSNPPDVDPESPTPGGNVQVWGELSRTRSVGPTGEPDLTWDGDSVLVGRARALE